MLASAGTPPSSLSRICYTYTSQNLQRCPARRLSSKYVFSRTLLCKNINKTFRMTPFRLSLPLSPHRPAGLRRNPVRPFALCVNQQNGTVSFYLKQQSGLEIRSLGQNLTCLVSVVVTPRSLCQPEHLSQTPLPMAWRTRSVRCTTCSNGHNLHHAIGYTIDNI